MQGPIASNKFTAKLRCTFQNISAGSMSHCYFAAFSTRMFLITFIAGTVGMNGMKGAKGSVGSKGIEGDAGIDGSVGSKGASGEKGSAGGDGDTGESGKKGTPIIKLLSQNDLSNLLQKKYL